MAGVAFRPPPGRQALQQAAGWSAVKGRLVFPTSTGTWGIHRWVSSHHPVENTLFLVGNRLIFGENVFAQHC